MPADFVFRTRTNVGFAIPAPGVLAGETGVTIDRPSPTWVPWPGPGSSDVRPAWARFGTGGVLWVTACTDTDWYETTLWRGDSLGVWQNIELPFKFGDSPQPILQHPNGDLYMLDRVSQALWVLDIRNNTWTKNELSFPTPNSLTIDSKGNMWVLSRRRDKPTPDVLYSYDPSTAAWRSETLPCEFCNSLAVTQIGELLALDKAGGFWLRRVDTAWQKVSDDLGTCVDVAPDGSWWVLGDTIKRFVEKMEQNEIRRDTTPMQNSLTVWSDEDPWVVSDDHYAPKEMETYTSVTKTSLGRIFWGANGDFRYLPDANASGVDTIAVPLTATTLGVVVPRLTMQITVEATSISAMPVRLFTAVNTPMSIALPSSNQGSGPVTYTITTPPANGSLSIPSSATNPRNRIQVYTPNAGWSGTDSFQFTASSGDLTSPPATVTIQVVRADVRLEWSTPVSLPVLVNPPGVLVARKGTTVQLPARTWRKEVADQVQVQGVALDATTEDIWMTGIEANTAYVWRQGPEGTRQAYGGTADLTLQRPRGVVVGSDSTVWVADPGAKALWSRSAATGTWTKVALADAPWGLALNAQGQLHVSFPSVPAIRRFDPATSTWTAVGTGTDSPTMPKGLAFDAQGRLWVADAFSHVVRRWSGTAWEKFGSASSTTYSGVGSLGTPRDVAVDATGNVWVADTTNGRIQVLNVATNVWTIVTNTPGAGETGFVRPTTVVVDPRGDAWAGDAKNVGLHRYAPFVVGTLGVAALRADGGMFYRPGKLPGYDTILLSSPVAGPAGRTWGVYFTVISP